MSGLETRNLSFSYGDKLILGGVTFSAMAGEAWAVIGRNGAGKSTLVKCLCGLLRAGGGAVFIDGDDIRDLPEREIALRVALVPQGHGRQAPPFTVREYAMMARFPYRGFWSSPSKEDRACVSEALAVTDAARLADRAMDTLSGGELQAALIAGAVAQGTRFLLLDEPTAYLDPYHRENIRRLINNVRTRLGTTVITVTHDVDLALSVHDNILALYEGKTMFCGTHGEFSVDAKGNLAKIFLVDFCEVEYPNNGLGTGKFYITRGAPS